MPAPNERDIRVCIVCREPKGIPEFNIEHVVPESLGNTALVIDCLCADCNGRLGSEVDSHLVSFLEIPRSILKIKGKSGNVPNPFDRGNLKGDPYQPVHVVSVEGTEPSIRILPRVSETTTEGNREHKQFFISDNTPGYKQISKDIFNKLIARSKALAGEVISPLTDDEFDELLESGEFVRGAAQFRIEERRLVNPVVEFKLEYDMRRVKLGFLKIAYEVMARQFGDLYLSDRRGKAIAKALHRASQGIIPGDDSLTGLIRSADLAAVKLLERENHHTILLLKSRQSVAVYISLFSRFGYCVVTSKSQRRYGLRPLWGRCIQIDPINRGLREVSLKEAIGQVEDAKKAQFLRGADLAT